MRQHDVSSFRSAIKTLNNIGPSINQEFTLLLQYAGQVTDHYPLSLAIELIFNPANDSFTKPLHLHLPNMNAEGEGIKGLSKIKVY